MMLIFEDTQLNTSDSVYQKPPPYLPHKERALFRMISKEIRK